MEAGQALAFAQVSPQRLDDCATPAQLAPCRRLLEHGRHRFFNLFARVTLEYAAGLRLGALLAQGAAATVAAIAHIVPPVAVAVATWRGPGDVGRGSDKRPPRHRSGTPT